LTAPITATLITLALLALAATASAGHTKTPRRHISHQRQHVVQMLNAGLAGTPMAGTGRQLEASGWKWHVNPAFMAAAAGLESAWGRLACAGNPWNLWGLGSCDRYWRVPHFATAAAAYDYYARFIRSHWTRARTPYDLAGYCECGSQSWGSRVAYNMDRLGFPAVVSYGAR
jgi:hypothetical protein